MYEGYKALRVEVRDAALWLTIDNPPVNASTAELRDDFERIFREAARDPAVRCAVLTGAGNTFSAGGDIRRMQRMLEDEVLGILNRVSCDEQQPAPTNGIETRGERLSRTESL